MALPDPLPTITDPPSAMTCMFCGGTMTTSTRVCLIVRCSETGEGPIKAFICPSCFEAVKAQFPYAHWVGINGPM